MKKVDFGQSAKLIVELIGGSENVVKVAHCITRVRFNLKDQALASKNSDKIKEIPGVMQVVESGGQYQVVIGPKVEEMYNEVLKVIGTVGEDSEEEKSNVSSQKKKPAQVIMKFISGVMMPTLPALIACGLISGLLSMLMAAGVIDSESGTYVVLHGIGQTCMYFYPVLLGGSTAKYFGMDTYVGNIIGAALIYPDFVAAADTVSDFLGIPLTFQSYASSVLPAVAAVSFAAVLYKFLKKHLPSILSFVFVPFLTVVITVPIALLVIGPVLTVISSALSTVYMTVYGFSPILCGILLGAVWNAFIIPLGLHWGFVAVFVNNVATLGFDPVQGLLCGFATLAGVCFAVAKKSRNADTKAVCTSAAVTDLLGIGEPALFGVILQHKATIITTVVTGAICGIIPAIFRTYVYTASALSGVFALPIYMNPDGTMASLIGAVLTNVAGFVIGFILTLIWRFDPDKETV